MAGAIWNGVIAFGLVSIPIRLHAATGSHDLGLHQYHAADGGRIRYQKVCELDDEVVAPEDIAKGWEGPDGEVVLLDDDDLADLPVSTSKSIEVLGFVPGAQIDPIHYERSYFAEPGKAAARAYVLLRDALVASERIAIVKITLRRRESLAALRPRDEVLLLHTMLWPDEIRRPEAEGLDAEAKRAELKMADTLIESMTMDFHPEEYTDAYQEALQERIEAKAAGRKATRSKSKRPPEAKVINLMDALSKSVDQAKGTKRRPAKKAAKQAAEKTAARKTAKKATARKQTAKRAATKAASKRASKRKSA